jgi:putative glutamine amidotransferase
MHAPAKPLVGITGTRVPAARVGGMPELLLGGAVDVHHTPYAAAVAASGGIPVQVPCDATPEEIVPRLDGLVVSGGNDVDPRLYGQRPGLYTTPLDPDQDHFELELIRAALEAKVPLLGICRGCQLMNVAKGGSLIGHLPLDEGEAHGQLAYPLHARVHSLRIVPDELLAGVLSDGTCVNSFHHQAVGEMGAHVVPLAYAFDGICEAIRIGRYALGVQWHPEYLREQPNPIFAWLIDAARGVAVEKEVYPQTCARLVP